MSRGRWRLASMVFGMVGLAYMAVALRDGLDTVQDLSLPTTPVLVLLVAIMAATFVVAYSAWMWLLGERWGWPSLAKYLVAQIGKYIPGAVWQPTAQVLGFGLAEDSTVGVAGSAQALVVQSLSQVAGASVFGLWILLVGPGIPQVVTIALVGIVATVALMYRPVLAWGVRLANRIRGQTATKVLLPSQAGLLGITAAGVVILGAQGWIFRVFLQAAAGGDAVGAMVPAYAVAWALGFLALPVPAGLGVREFILVSLLPEIAPAIVVAASVGVRVIQVAAEASLLGSTLVGKVVVERSG